MSASGTFKQGDHVFNAVDGAILRPYETLASLRTDLIGGQEFVHYYLVQSYSVARDLAHKPVFSDARKYVATAGIEQDTIRELTKLRSRHPTLARVTSTLLRHIHTRNSENFGAAAAQYEVEVLLAIRVALENAVAPPDLPPPARITRGPGLAFQHMLDTAYDPATALCVITGSMASEQPAIHSNFHSVIIRLAETLDRPGMWKDPYNGFREQRRTNTGEAITVIGSVLLRMDGLKAQSLLLTKWIAEEIAQKAQVAGRETIFGSITHLLHSRLQQMGHWS
jgi:hypothetical protein